MDKLNPGIRLVICVSGTLDPKLSVVALGVTSCSHLLKFARLEKGTLENFHKRLIRN